MQNNKNNIIKTQQVMERENYVKQIKVTSIKSLEIVAKEIAETVYHHVMIDDLKRKVDYTEDKEFFEKEMLAGLMKTAPIIKLNQVVLMIGKKSQENACRGNFSMILQGNACNVNGNITEELNKTKALTEFYCDEAWWDVNVMESLDQTLVVVTESY